MEENKQYLETVPDVRAALEDDDDDRGYGSSKKS